MLNGGIGGSWEGMMPAGEEQWVDARGQPCPHPVLAARAALRDRPPGSRIVLLADDPLASVDVAAWCARSGRRLVSEQVDGAGFRFVIEVP